MTLPLLGVALTHKDIAPLRDWIFDAGRAIEIQDFVMPEVIAGDTAPLIAACRAALDGHQGPLGLHGPFFGLDLSNPDRDIRAVIRTRLMQGLDVAQALGADQMVVHSPFTYWHVLNYANYSTLRETLFEAAADCLAPVLERAADTGCTLVLENIDDTDPRDRVDLVARIGHPALRVSIDTGHAQLAHGRYGAPPVVDFIDAAAGYLAHVHVQDADGYADRHWAPGEGNVPWAPVFAALAASDPAPRLLLEVRNRLERLPACVAALEARGFAR
ncbi:sugar phosphate isomerase/epimerase family protein [Halodurantibacterium flavum]|uniref:Sugar phosphate isomerase/epimerase family protein n=1 Tax=Halodurantibacterium flavum TaxID=1382802 RepID=A0ABW4S2E9_9RHOB